MASTARKVYGRIVDPSGDPLGINKDAAAADISGLQGQAALGTGYVQQIRDERAGLALNKSPQDQAAAQQAAAIAKITAAANGTGTSAGQQQLQDQAQLDAARQVGLAKAIRGHSAGGSAYQTAAGVAQVQAQAQQQNELLKAQEQAAARQQLAGSLQDQRTQDLGAYRTDQQERDTNLAALLQQRQTAAGIAEGQAQANAIAAGGENQKNAAEIGAVGAGAQTLVSDARAKRITAMAGAVRRAC